MKTRILITLVATISLAAGKIPGAPRPDPPEKAFIVTIGPEDQISVGGVRLNDEQAEAMLKVFVASTKAPAIVIQIDDIDAPGKRCHHMNAIFERVRARSDPFDHWFVYSPDAKARLEQRKKAKQAAPAGGGKPSS
jgi:hypothetical protein